MLRSIEPFPATVRTTVEGMSRTASAPGLEASGHGVAVGSLALQIDVDLSNPETCPSGTPTAFQCFARTGSAVVPGLGDVHESHNYVLENRPAGSGAAVLAAKRGLPPRATVPTCLRR